jgi:prepilin-type N-terminal cleavage/methylation domain-containing protein
MWKRPAARPGGFTLIELLIVVAIIGLLAAMIIPNMIGAMQKAKQRRTMADQRDVGTGMMAWLTDNCGAAAAGAPAVFSIDLYTLLDPGDLATDLLPRYIQVLPERDGWGSEYEYRFNRCAEADHIMAIRSFGQDRVAEGDVYSIGGFDPKEYDRDIVWADGYFISWPSGVDTSVAP